MEKLKVKNVVISKQAKTSNNFEKFLEIVKEKKINLITVNIGDKLNIANNLYFQILWPDANQFITDNALNNNSIVCKLVYNNFSCLFTGDIEEIAEKAILNKYRNNLNILKADILKVAHHGSKTSSSKEFLESVSPKFALIGVGSNNTFGHPSSITLESLKLIKCQIYRTDKDGEIIVQTDGKETANSVCIYRANEENK